MSWHWISWQGSALAMAMIACIAIGMPRRPIDRKVLAQADLWGRLHSGTGFALLYAALDQGNRLDWLNSGIIVGLLAASTVPLVCFVVRETTCPLPWIDLQFLMVRNIGLVMECWRRIGSSCSQPPT